MSSEEKQRRISAPTIALLRKFVDAQGPIYKINSEQAGRLLALGVIARPDPRGPYYLTSEAEIVLAAYDAQSVRPKRKNPTQMVIDHVESLQLPGISRGEIIEHLEVDEGRGTDTSKKFKQKNKGIRFPRLKGKA